MSKHFSHFNTARQIIQQYDGEMPLAAWLKNFFARDKKYGSGDRRAISAYCYNYYRTGNMLQHLQPDDRLLAANFLLHQLPASYLEDVKPAWTEKASANNNEKLQLLQVHVQDLFPFTPALSKMVDASAFAHSFLTQPRLFIRTRPEQRLLVEKKLQASGIDYEQVDDQCLAFENGINLSGIAELNQDYVVQDYNSQQVFSLINFLQHVPGSANVWDCCAASGGKAILATDLLKNIQLSVSDVRASILTNLHKRLKEAGIKHYHSFEADLSIPQAIAHRFKNRPFNLVICDAPCSGSGTWARTPEQLLFFKSAEIERYSSLQKKIASNVVSAIANNGYLLYITCSVFARENEEVVQYLTENHPLRLVEMKLFEGYSMRADSMFAALLQVTA